MSDGSSAQQWHTWYPASREEWLRANGWKAPALIHRAHSSSFVYLVKPQMSAPANQAYMQASLVWSLQSCTLL